MDLQRSSYKLVCVAKGSLKNKPEEATYYVVVESDRLLQIRKAVLDLYVHNGGKAEDFKAEVFYPHVTLGFTKRDLHFEDGVIKDQKSCLYPLSGESQKN